MAIMSKEWKRKVRINCMPDRFDGRALDIVDAETGEPIRNILSMVIRLDAKSVNTCEITYHEVDGDALRMDKENTITVKDIEIDDLAAFEIMDSIRKEKGYND